MQWIDLGTIRDVNGVKPNLGGPLTNALPAPIDVSDVRKWKVAWQLE